MINADLISYEQSTALPFPAAGRVTRSEPNAYHIIKEEMNLFIQSHFRSKGEFPSDDELRQTGLAAMETAERVLKTPSNGASSWLRDIFTITEAGCDQQLLDHRNEVVPSPDQSWETGTSLFENFSLENQLRRFVRMHIVLGRSLNDDEIQEEACLILRRAESSSLYTSRHLLGFLTRLVRASTAWILPLRERARMDLMGFADSNMHLEEERSYLGQDHPASNSNSQWTNLQGTTESEFEASYLWTDPLGTNDTSIQSQTIEQMALNSSMIDDCHISNLLPNFFSPSLLQPASGLGLQRPTAPSQDTGADGEIAIRMPSDHFINSGYSLDGGASLGLRSSEPPCDNSYQRLARELALYVAKALSPDNPERHMPTDDELRNQGRLILFDE